MSTCPAIISRILQRLAVLQSSQVFPQLYLPLMTEGNLRTLRPWRMYIPTPSWFRHRCISSQRMSDPSAEQPPKYLTEELLNWCWLGLMPCHCVSKRNQGPGQFISTAGQFVCCQQRCHWIQMQLASKSCTPTDSVCCRQLLGQLDTYVIGLLRQRWKERLQGPPSKPDLLDRRIAGMMVTSASTTIIVQHAGL